MTRPDGDTEANETCLHTLTRLRMRDVTTGYFECICCDRLVYGDEANDFTWDERTGTYKYHDDVPLAWCWDCAPIAERLKYT